MHKVLIVDDDKLVRKGMIYTIPWSDYGFEIVGEANNGETALEFLEQNEVDLIFTDLLMPVMSGIEFMRIARLKYPDKWIVVLSFYQEFEYVQEALRLGAIDYISKTQLEKEQIEDIMKRIVSRIDSDELKQKNKTLSSKMTGYDFSNVNRALVYILAESESEEAFIKMLSIYKVEFFHRIDRKIWFIPEYDSNLKFFSSNPLFDFTGSEDWIILRISDFKGMDIDAVFKIITDYNYMDFFYDYEVGKSLYELSVKKLHQNRIITFETDFIKLKEKWSSLYWTFNDQTFNFLIAEVERIRPNISKLKDMFSYAFIYWNRIVELDSFDSREVFDNFKYWSDYVEWLNETRRVIRSMTQKQQYSDEVSESIINAIKLIDGDLTSDITLVEIAGKVNMSRSYFSRCFKDITGKSFIDFVRGRRIQNAELLLEQTQKPIYWISQMCGYRNEKYFSRVFKDITGIIPSEYRNNRLKKDPKP